MISLDPSDFPAERVVGGLQIPRRKTPAEQLLFEDKAGATVSLRGTEAVPFRPPLQVGLGHIIMILVEHENSLEDEIEKRLQICPLQLGTALLRGPCHEAWVEGDRDLTEEGVEIQFPERILAGRAALAAAA